MADTPEQLHRHDVSATNEVSDAFAKLAGAFPVLASFQGVHFKYAVRNGTVLVECKHNGRYYYWILAGDTFLLIHSSEHSKLRRMQTITDATFTPSKPYNSHS